MPILNALFLFALEYVECSDAGIYEEGFSVSLHSTVIGVGAGGKGHYLPGWGSEGSGGDFLEPRCIARGNLRPIVPLACCSEWRLDLKQAIKGPEHWLWQGLMGRWLESWQWKSDVWVNQYHGPRRTLPPCWPPGGTQQDLSQNLYNFILEWKRLSTSSTYEDVEQLELSQVIDGLVPGANFLKSCHGDDHRKSQPLPFYIYTEINLYFSSKTCPRPLSLVMLIKIQQKDTKRGEKLYFHLQTAGTEAGLANFRQITYTKEECQCA